MQLLEHGLVVTEVQAASGYEVIDRRHVVDWQRRRRLYAARFGEGTVTREQAVP
jgi:hypothetical protein